MSRRGFDGGEDPRAIAYLVEKGVWVPGARHAENMARCFEAINRWATPNPVPGKQWAHEVLAAHESGGYAPDAAVKLALKALGREKAPLRVPPRSGPRPDAAEAAAGDVAADDDVVEVSWP